MIIAGGVKQGQEAVILFYSIPLLPNLAQIPVITPATPHIRWPGRELLRTNSRDHTGNPLPECRDALLVRDVIDCLVILEIVERGPDGTFPYIACTAMQ